MHDAVVISKQNNEDSHLLAFVTVEKNTEFSEQVLQSYLKAKLPSYMIPRYFIESPILPLTTSGKIDRKALLALYDENIISKSKISLSSEIADSIKVLKTTLEKAILADIVIVIVAYFLGMISGAFLTF